MEYGPVWLFAPANAARKAQGALASAADVVVLDLEDAVPPAEKVAARAALAELATLPRRAALFVRVNAPGTPLCLRDIEAAVAARVDGIMLPKTETPADVAAVCFVLAQLDAEQGRSSRTELIPLIETALGMTNLPNMRWDPRVTSVAFGSVDYEADLNLVGDAAQGAVEHARHAIVLASRATGLAPPIDGVTLQVRDTAQCLHDASHARGLGFGGKLAVHPVQIDPIQAAFRPSADEVAWAEEVTSSFAAAVAEGTGAIVVRGRLVDGPVLTQAERVLALAAKG